MTIYATPYVVPAPSRPTPDGRRPFGMELRLTADTPVPELLSTARLLSHWYWVGGGGPNA